MANYSINIPGTTPVGMQKDDYLTINFLTNDRFCISSGNADDFNPPLPVNNPNPMNPWTGQAVVTNATIHYSHVGHDKECGSPNPRNVPPGTIQIGSGMK